MSEKHVVKTEWKGNMAFVANCDGHEVLMDTKSELGGQNLAATPKKLLLAALCGCTGMDVVSILKKMRVEIESCNLQVEAEVNDEHPKYYTKMHLVYHITGKDLPMDKVEKAIKMSEETYCGVGALYRKAIHITSEIKIN